MARKRQTYPDRIARGVLDRHYGLRAQEITSGNVTTAAEISAKMGTILRGDVDFRAAALTHRVSKSPLARYYLRALELKMQGVPNPELGGVLEDTVLFNLEHLMPLSPAEGWDISAEILQANNKRLGNMALLNPEANVGGGNRPFIEKVPIYKASPLLLTQAIAEHPAWGPDEIDARQTTMAELAVAVWPL